jgi:hypothetical protein
MSKDKELNLCVEKSSDTSRISLTFLSSLPEALAWVGNAQSFRITDTDTCKVVKEKNGIIFDKQNLNTAKDLVDTASRQIKLKRNFY